MIVGARKPSVATMRAARHRQWGAPLEIGDAPRPEPAAGEVRIAVQATSVNPIDMYTGRNSGYEQSMRLPFIPGWDVAGVVDALGYGVTRHAVGDRLYGLVSFPYPGGTYAQFLTAPAHQLTATPATASFAAAGCLPMAALTAWQMLDAARVAPGQRILVSGASGGVGHVAVQLARARGADVVALARVRDHATLYELGATECIDYTDLRAVGEIAQVDALVDLVGHEFGRSLFGRVAPGGTVVLSTAWSVPTYRDDAEEYGIRARACLVEPDAAALAHIAALFDAGRLRVIVGATYHLAQAAEAQSWVTQRRGPGKVAIVTEET